MIMNKGVSVALVMGSFLLMSAVSKPQEPKSCQVPEGEFVIYGELQNVPDSTVIELARYDGKIRRSIAFDTVIDGKFVFRDTITGPNIRKLYLCTRIKIKGIPSDPACIWVKSGAGVRITGNDCLPPLWSIESNVLEQQAENEFSKLALNDRRQMLKYSTERDDLFAAHPNLDFDKPTMKKLDSLAKLYLHVGYSIVLQELNYMKEAPVTAVWLDRYATYVTFLQWNKSFGHEDLIRSLYDRMSEADRATEEGQLITAYLNLPEVVNVGDQMVDGDLYDVKGNLHHLSEFKGKYIMLDFWSQGCGPCLQSLPELKEVSEMYKDSLEIVSISMDTKESWSDFVERKGLTGNQWNEFAKGTTGLAAVYQVKAIPRYVMITPEGIVVGMWSGYGPGSIKEKVQHLIQEEQLGE